MIKPVRVDKIVPNGRHLAKSVLGRALRIKLPFEVRSKSRFSEKLPDGREANFFLPRGNVLVEGDVLVADDGTMVLVSVADQKVLTILSADTFKLTKAAYHLGNRHIPVQIGEGFLRIEPDPVLEGMIRQLGLEAKSENAPFEPESGAYGGGHRHGHAETFDSDYALAQKVYADHDHVHGPDCVHHHGDHAHKHEH